MAFSVLSVLEMPSFAGFLGIAGADHRALDLLATVSPDLSTPAEQSAIFEAIQAAAVSPLLDQLEERQKFRRLLERYLEVCDSLLKNAILLLENKGKTVADVARMLERVESLRRDLRLLVSLRPTALRRNRNLAAVWSRGVDRRMRDMIRAYDDSVAKLQEPIHRYESAMQGIKDAAMKARLNALDMVGQIGTEEEQRESWQLLRRELDEERPSGRKLFPPE